MRQVDEKRETSTKTCNETMLRDKLRVFVHTFGCQFSAFRFRKKGVVIIEYDHPGRDHLRQSNCSLKGFMKPWASLKYLEIHRH